MLQNLDEMLEKINNSEDPLDTGNKLAVDLHKNLIKENVSDVNLFGLFMSEYSTRESYKDRTSNPEYLNLMRAKVADVFTTVYNEHYVSALKNDQ